MPGVIGSSAAVVLAWGYFLWQGVQDPLGGINSLWPLYGTANQLLAAVALCLGTTIMIKMHRLRYVWITGIPLLWLVTVTFTAGYQKLFSPIARIGFLAQSAQLRNALASGTVAADQIAATRTLIFNARLDAVVCAVFLLMVTTILADSLRIWIGILRGTRSAKLHEAPYVMAAPRPKTCEVDVM